MKEQNRLQYLAGLNENYTQLEEPQQLDEAVGSLIIGGLLAAPKVLEWVGKAIGAISKKFSKSGDESEVAQTIEKFAHKWEHVYLGLIKRLIKITGLAKSVWSDENGVNEEKLETTSKVIYAIILAVAAGYAVKGVLTADSVIIKAIESAVGGVKGVEISQIASKLKASL
jgi:hypothetical protein